MASVEFEDVEKTYPGGTRALRSFDLRVEDGERMVVEGSRNRRGGRSGSTVASPTI
jgi:hypothetical protein